MRVAVAHTRVLVLLRVKGAEPPHVCFRRLDGARAEVRRRGPTERLDHRHLLVALGAAATKCRAEEGGGLPQEGTRRSGRRVRGLEAGRV